MYALPASNWPKSSKFAPVTRSQPAAAVSIAVAEQHTQQLTDWGTQRGLNVGRELHIRCDNRCL